MNDLDAILDLEQGESTPLQEAQALQRLLNSGLVWRLQGSHGRAAMAALESGRNMLGKVSTSDGWGNRVPSRFEVQCGTKGSSTLVADEMGDEWLAALESVE